MTRATNYSGVNDHPHSGWLGFPPQAERQKHEGASIVAFVTARKARGLKQTIKKQYLKSRNACKVTFRLPRTAVPQAHEVCIAGEFNSWNTHINPMKKLKSGDFTITLELEPGKEYQFRYLIDGTVWENDWNADTYVPSPYGHCDNSVVLI